MQRKPFVIAALLVVFLNSESFQIGAACLGCDAVVRKARAVDRDGDFDCDVIVKGVDPTPGDEFEVRLHQRARPAIANSRGRWKVRFSDADGGPLVATACGTSRDTFCNGFPPLTCGDVLAFDVVCDGHGNLTVRTILRDTGRHGDTVRFGVVRTGGQSGMSFSTRIVGNEAISTTAGWSGELDVVLMQPPDCFPAWRTYCGPLRERWCEFTLTEDMEVVRTCAHATCSYKKGTAFCPDCGPSCSDEDPDCTGDAGFFVACWTDENNGYLTGWCEGTGKHTGCKCPR